MLTAERIESAAGTETARPDELVSRVKALAAELAELAATGAPATPDGVCIDQIGALEVLKSAACAAQACVSAQFAGSQRAEQEQAGVAPSRAGRGIPAQIGLARRESPHKAKQLVGLAISLVSEMPYTLAALARGDLNEWRATLIARETAVLSREHRAAVDREMCGPGGNAATLGDTGTVRAARAIGQRLDPGAAWARAERAARERRVTIRPAPDCMARITALLPVVQGVGVFAALAAAADTAIATGQSTAGPDDVPAGRQALMADELVARVLGRVLAPTKASPNIVDSPENSDSPASSSQATDSAPAPGQGEAAGAADPAISADPATADVADGVELADAADPARAADAADPPRAADLAERRVVREPAVELQLIMTDWTLFGLDDEPAHLTGYGPIPAPLARRIATGDLAGDSSNDPGGGAGLAVRWIRRLYRQSGTGTDIGGTYIGGSGTGRSGTGRSGTGGSGTGSGGLIAMDSRRRLFPAAISRFIVARDQFCRTPWCDALIRHIDHIKPAGDDGPTSTANAQGLCEACNYSKEAPGWQQATEGQGGDVVTTTPTGHHYDSSPPPPPGGFTRHDPAEHGVAA